MDGSSGLPDLFNVKTYAGAKVGGMASALAQNYDEENEGRLLTLDSDLIFLSFALRDGHTLQHGHVSDTFLTQEVSDFHRPGVVGNDDVDGEMCVDRSHLVKKALGHTNDHLNQVVERERAYVMGRNSA